jgi:hypothetical protein
MTLQHWLGMVCGVAVIAFIVLSFRQGEKLKPDDRRDGGPVSRRSWRWHWTYLESRRRGFFCAQWPSVSARRQSAIPILRFEREHAAAYDLVSAMSAHANADMRRVAAGA